LPKKNLQDKRGME